MLIEFFLKLKESGVPVSVREFLTLLEALQKRVVSGNVDDFYYLARACLVKDEKYFDRFDRAFGAYFKGVLDVEGIAALIPEEWLKKLAEKHLTEEEKKLVEALGGWDKLMETLKQRLEEQKGRHQGGSKWIGTAGTSPFGAYGYNPEGVRIGQHESRHRRAVKVWDQREFKNFDDTVEIGTRNIKVALKRLRKFAREGNPEELDLDDTIRSTAKNAGWLDLKMVPERHNSVKVLLFLDVGGSMDDHIRVCEQLFSAARTEFKHLEYFYFHNFLHRVVGDAVRVELDEALHFLRIVRGDPARGGVARGSEARFGAVFMPQPVGDDVELQAAGRSEQQRAARMRPEHLDGAFFTELGEPRAQLFAAQGIRDLHALEEFRREERQTGELQVFAFGKRVAQLQHAVVGDADDIAGIGFLQQVAAL
jgi:uncharacterized protein